MKKFLVIFRWVIIQEKILTWLGVLSTESPDDLRTESFNNCRHGFELVDWLNPSTKHTMYPTLSKNGVSYVQH